MESQDRLYPNYRQVDTPRGTVLSFSPLSYDITLKNNQEKTLVDNISVDIRAGELLAIMGPSGAGKSTLLDLMSFRLKSKDGGEATFDGLPLGSVEMQDMSSFVEQEDALLGVLTVRETISYALRLSMPLLPRKEVVHRVNRVLSALGLQNCADQKIGTPISRGISGGQKRRVTAACAMITLPSILLLDEVTSGLDSTSAREVISAIRKLAIEEGIVCIATIHQPSLEVLAQFDHLLLLAQGRRCWYGKVTELAGFFLRWGKPVPQYKTPSDHAMDLLNGDFTELTGNKSSSQAMRDFFLSERLVHEAAAQTVFAGASLHSLSQREGKAGYMGTLFWNTVVLSERTAKNYIRNLLAYGVRLGMYLGMGLMLATIWVNLGTRDSTINDRLSVHFFSVAFLAFMSVAGIPSFLEERAVFYRERKNGLYSTLPFVLANTWVNVPFLFICTLVFTLICYWAIGLHPGPEAFGRFLVFLFFAILVAESQVLIVSALLPIFVAALAIGAFMNGFWMSVGGYFIKARSLPKFWYYSFHFIDYQKYAFELLVTSDLRGLTFACEDKVDNVCICAYPSSTPEQCTVSGEDVLRYLGIETTDYGNWVGILFSILLIYRITLYLALKFRTK